MGPEGQTDLQHSWLGSRHFTVALLGDTLFCGECAFYRKVTMGRKEQGG